ncbi:Asp23/Gls24 family envelope stress response protein [Kitasatospora sp. NBC_00315]|uniref:Asp23/Gls24 family envelope stress response protein n=1 Tax=Kitasatospora sp. NBC_00315 TaxID=2975963 RepID=UPI003250FAE4
MPAVVAPSAADGRRGSLRIADRVFAKIAARAARDALETAWVGRAGRGAPPDVSVSVPGRTATVRVGVELPFPADLASLARAVRDRVAEQVVTLTGTRVAEVTVVVERLLPKTDGE